MIKETLKRLGYSDEDITKITNGMKEDKVYTTKQENMDERYPKIKSQKQALEDQLKTANDTIKDLKKNNSSNEELQTKVNEYEGKIKTLTKESEEKVKNLTLDNAINTLLVKNKAKYSELLAGKFERDKLVIKEDGTIEGLEDQFKGIQESYKDMFEGTTQSQDSTYTYKPKDSSGEQCGSTGSSQSTFMNSIYKNQVKR